MDTKPISLSIRTRLGTFFNQKLVNLALPAICQLCAGRANGTICQACMQTLPLNLNGCEVCDLPLVGQGPLCADCLRTPPTFDRVISGLRYEAPLNRPIRQFKEAYGFHWLAPLLDPLLCRIREHYAEQYPEKLVAVPMHWRKKMKRGYNQSTILADVISRTLNIPVADYLSKSHETESQRELKRKQRMKNLVGSFHCKVNLDGEHLAVVDDVLTTGATAECIARVLKAAGAGRVDIWTIARTPKISPSWYTC